MNIIVKDTKAEASKEAFALIEKAIKAGEAKTLGLATGNTPTDLYKEFVNSDVDTSTLVSINLDEYVGLSAEDPNSYHFYMNDVLFSKKNV